MSMISHSGRHAQPGDAAALAVLVLAIAVATAALAVAAFAGPIAFVFTLALTAAPVVAATLRPATPGRHRAGAQR